MEGKTKYPDGEYVRNGDIYEWRWAEEPTSEVPEVEVEEPKPKEKRTRTKAELAEALRG